MSNLSAMLAQQADDLKETLIPVGTWQSEIRSAKFTTPKNDKNGKEFVQALFMLKLTAPGHDVDPSEAQGIDFDRETVFYRFGPIYGAPDLARLKKILIAVGVQSSGRTVEDMLKDSRGAQVNAEIEHETYQNELRTVVKKVYAAA